MGNWNDLSIKERAELIHLYMDGGVLDLPSMRKHYNSFAGGGDTDDYTGEDDIEEYILPIVHSSRMLSPYSRRHIKKLAREDYAAGDNSTYIEDATTKKQKIYNKAFNKERQKALEQERKKELKRAAVEELQSGNKTGAFDEYTREGIESMAPFAMGVVGASAAPWLVGGAQAVGPYAAKGLQLMGEYAMPSALTKGAAYYLPGIAKEAAVLGQIGDTAAMSYWTLKGLQSAKKNFGDKKYADSVAEAATSVMPFVPAAMGMAREGKRAWDATKDFRENVGDFYELLTSPRSFKRGLKRDIKSIEWLAEQHAKVSKDIESALRNRPVYRAANVEASYTRPSVSLGGITKDTHPASYDDGTKTGLLSTYTTATAGTETEHGDLSAYLPADLMGFYLEPAIPFKTYKEIESPRPRLDQFGWGYNDEAKIGEVSYAPMRAQEYKSIKKQDIERLHKNESAVLDPSPFGINGRLTTSKEVSDSIVIPQKVDSPDNEGSSLLRDYVSFLNNKLQRKGIATGSNILYSEGAASGTPGDTEILTTKSRLGEVKDAIGFNHDLGSTGLVDEGHSPIAINVGDNKGKVDIQIIDEDDSGNAVGRIAWQMFRTMHPDECVKQAAMSATTKTHYSNQSIINPATGRSYTPEELLDEFSSGDYILQYEVDNALALSKHYSNKVLKENRPLGILTSKSPKVKEAVSKSIDTMGRSQVGDGYIKGSDYFSDIDFSDVEENKKFLKRLGLDSLGIENDKEAMRNIFDYWYMQQSCQKRAVRGDGESPAVIRKWIFDSNFARTGGDWSGSGRNTLAAFSEQMGMGYPYVGAMQNHLTSNPSKTKSLSDVLTQVDKTKPDYQLGDNDVLRAAKKVSDLSKNITSTQQTLKQTQNGFELHDVYNVPIERRRSVNALINNLVASKTTKNVDDAILEFARSAKNELDDQVIEDIINVVSEELDLPFITTAGYSSQMGTPSYRGVLKKHSGAGEMRYFDSSDGDKPFEFGKDIEGYKKTSAEKTWIADKFHTFANDDDIINAITDYLDFDFDSKEDQIEKLRKAVKARTLGDVMDLVPLYSNNGGYTMLDIPELIDYQSLLSGEVRARLRRLERKGKIPGYAKLFYKTKREIENSDAVPTNVLYRYATEAKPKPKLSKKPDLDKDNPKDYELPW